MRLGHWPSAIIALDSATRLVLLEALSDAASEITSELAPGSVMCVYAAGAGVRRDVAANRAIVRRRRSDQHRDHCVR